MKNILIAIVLIIIGIKSTAQVKNRDLFIDSVFDYICESKILHPEIVIKQAILETGWFKSKFLMNKNNIFAFRKKKYLSFNSWKESVDYYKSWQKKHYTNTQENYYQFLVRIKYATPEYPLHLKKINCIKSCN
jgi:uncharacterized FlgJ-related protein